jgi:hypothetical protein
VRLEDLLRGMGLVLLLLLAAEVGLEDAGRAHGQKILIGDRLGLHQTLVDQRFQVCLGSALGKLSLSLFGQAVAVESQALAAQLLVRVGKLREDLLQAVRIVGRGAARAVYAAHQAQQLVVQGAALACQRDAALLDLAKAGGMGAGTVRVGVGIGKAHGLLERLEAGLAQQDRAGALRRAFDHVLGIHAARGHIGLGHVDVQRAWRQMVDVRALEAHHIGHQAVGFCRAL